MFVMRGPNVAVDKEHNLSIVGDFDRKLCILKRHHDILYVGSQHDCEYIAQWAVASERGIHVPLYLDLFGALCGKDEIAARTVSYDETARGYIVYGASNGVASISGDSCSALAQLFQNYSNYAQEADSGKYTITVRNKQSGERLTVSYTHGVQVSYSRRRFQKNLSRYGTTTREECRVNA